MKAASSALILLVGLVYGIKALPATLKQEGEIIPLEKQGRQPIIDVDTDDVDGPFGASFGSLFGNIESLLLRMRQQMETLIRGFPSIYSRNGTTENISDIPGFPNVPTIGDVDLSKGNTTSVTKIINGHKVVINDTEYNKQDDFGGAFFKVRIIDVKPDGEEFTTNKNVEAVTASVKDRESVENSNENEISKSREVYQFENLETFDESENMLTNLLEGNSLESKERFKYDTIDSPLAEVPVDLSRDTYVNQILADQGTLTNPDAEVFWKMRYKRNVR